MTNTETRSEWRRYYGYSTAREAGKGRRDLDRKLHKRYGSDYATKLTHDGNQYILWWRTYGQPAGSF